MHLNARWEKRELRFKKPAGTSRGVLLNRPLWLLYLWFDNQEDKAGIGECPVLPGLSIDHIPDADFEHTLEVICRRLTHQFPGIPDGWENRKFWTETLAEWVPDDFPSIRFGLETALTDLFNGGSRLLWKGGFVEGKEAIPINGLIWMSPIDEMWNQVHYKIREGFTCIKLKIGTHSFKEELKLIENIRKLPGGQNLTIRVDANGAYKASEVPQILSALKDVGVESIEQPIKPKQWIEMAELCANSNLPIAIDEELVVCNSTETKIAAIEAIKPQYLILKPGLLGGVNVCEELINVAEKMGIGWWITSALESNIGLNAIAQFTAKLHPSIPQGLGTGALYEENFTCPLIVDRGFLKWDTSKRWSADLVAEAGISED